MIEIVGVRYFLGNSAPRPPLRNTESTGCFLLLGGYVGTWALVELSLFMEQEADDLQKTKCLGLEPSLLGGVSQPMSLGLPLPLSLLSSSL